MCLTGVTMRAMFMLPELILFRVSRGTGSGAAYTYSMLSWAFRGFLTAAVDDARPVLRPSFTSHREVARI